jgi:4-hydroxy-tetrahydrodipicolinate synthase
MDADKKKFVPVMITPFDQKTMVDADCLARLIDFYRAAGVSGFFANCLSSEMFSITADERIELARRVVSDVHGDMPVVASGSFGDSIEQKAEFIKKMYQTGVSAVIMITGHLASPHETDEVLLQNFEKLLALTGNIPLGLYECPAPYKRTLSPGVFESLLSTSRFIYHKDTSISREQVRSKLDVLQKSKNNNLEFYDAHAANAMYSLQLGARGVSSISGNFYPEIMVWMCDHATDAGRQKEVQWLQSEIDRVDLLLHDAYPLSAKYFLKKRGLPIHLISRSWIVDLTGDQQKTLDSVHSSFLGWCEELKIKPVEYRHGEPL